MVYHDFHSTILLILKNVRILTDQGPTSFSQGTTRTGPRPAHNMFKDTRQGGVDLKLFQIDLVGYYEN